MGIAAEGRARGRIVSRDVHHPVVGPALVEDRGALGERRFDRTQTGEVLVIDLQGLEAILGQVAILGYDGRDGCPNVPDAIPAHGKGSDRSNVVEEVREGLHVGQVLPRDHEDDVGEAPRGLRPDRRDPRVRRLAPEDGHLRHARERQVGDECPPAREQAIVFDPVNASPDVVRPPGELWCLQTAGSYFLFNKPSSCRAARLRPCNKRRKEMPVHGCRRGGTIVYLDTL